MKNIKISHLIVLIVGILIGFYLRPSIKPDKVIVKVDTIYKDTNTVLIDTVPILIKQTKFLKVHDTIIVEKEGKIRIDTLAIVQDYISSRTYETSLDTNDVELHILDIVHMNTLKEQRISIKNNRVTSITQINPACEKTREFYIGGNYIQGKYSNFGVSLLFKDKRNNIFEIGPTFDKMLGGKFGFYKKIN